MFIEWINTFTECFAHSAVYFGGIKHLKICKIQYNIRVLMFNYNERWLVGSFSHVCDQGEFKKGM